MNKRRNIRQRCAVPVEAKAGTAFAKTTTLDISQGGIGFLGPRLPLRRKIAVEILLPSQSVLAVGKVCWSKRENSKLYRFGFKFSKSLSGSLPELKKAI